MFLLLTIFHLDDGKKLSGLNHGKKNSANNKVHEYQDQNLGHCFTTYNIISSQIIYAVEKAPRGTGN